MAIIKPKYRIIERFLSHNNTFSIVAQERVFLLFYEDLCLNKDDKGRRTPDFLRITECDESLKRHIKEKNDIKSPVVIRRYTKHGEISK